MARFAPAACNPCAIAHAIERLLATPKTTAVRPFKSSNMNKSPVKKRKNTSISARVGRAPSPAVFVLGVGFDFRNQIQNQSLRTRTRTRTRVSAPHHPYLAAAATAARARTGQHAEPNATAYTAA